MQDVHVQVASATVRYTTSMVRMHLVANLVIIFFFRCGDFFLCHPVSSTGVSNTIFAFSNTSMAHSLGHYWWKQAFSVFGTGFDRPSARLHTAKIVLWYPSRHILSQHPHSHPSEWVARGHRGRQNRQHSKIGRKVHKLHQCSSHSPPYKPHGVRTRKHFFSPKSKKKPENS